MPIEFGSGQRGDVRVAEQDFLYELRLCKPLPRTTLNRFVVQWFLSSQAAEHFVWFENKHHTATSCCFLFGIAMGVTTLFLRHGWFRDCMVWVFLVLSMVGWAINVGTYNMDLVARVVRCWDFWFLALSSFGFGMIMSCMMEDSRDWIGFVLFLSFLSSILADANIRRRTLELRVTIVMLPLSGTAFIAFLSHNVQGAKYRSFSVHGLSVSDTDVLMSTGIAISVFLISTRILGNRKWLTTAETQQPTRRVFCHLIRPDHQIVLASAMRNSVGATEKRFVKSCKEQLCELRMVPLHSKLIDARDTLGQAHMSLPLAASTISRSIPFFGFVGFNMFLFEIFYEFCELPPVSRNVHVGCAMMACACSTVCFIIFGLYLQRELLRLLFTQVGTLFATLELSIVTFCLCDAFRWDYHVFVCMAAYVWYHWTMCMDALPPLTRELLHYRDAYCTAVLSLMVMYLVSVGVVVFFSRRIVDEHDNEDPTTLRNRVLVDFNMGLKGGHIRVETMSLLVSNWIILLCWSMRALWRQIALEPAVLRVLQSQLSYGLPPPVESQVRVVVSSKLVVQPKKSSRCQTSGRVFVSRKSFIQPKRSSRYETTSTRASSCLGVE